MVCSGVDAGDGNVGAGVRKRLRGEVATAREERDMVLP